MQNLLKGSKHKAFSHLIKIIASFFSDELKRTKHRGRRQTDRSHYASAVVANGSQFHKYSFIWIK